MAYRIPCPDTPLTDRHIACMHDVGIPWEFLPDRYSDVIMIDHGYAPYKINISLPLFLYLRVIIQWLYMSVMALKTPATRKFDQHLALGTNDGHIKGLHYWECIMRTPVSNKLWNKNFNNRKIKSMCLIYWNQWYDTDFTVKHLI